MLVNLTPLFETRAGQILMLRFRIIFLQNDENSCIQIKLWRIINVPINVWLYLSIGPLFQVKYSLITQKEDGRELMAVRVIYTLLCVFLCFSCFRVFLFFFFFSSRWGKNMKTWKYVVCTSPKWCLFQCCDEFW